MHRHAAMPTWHQKPGPFAGQRQRGQALILAVICLLVLCLAFLAVFDTGQVVSKKVQLTNAADAAAYSVAIEQARALNTIAYLNRAEVANQIFVAQVVSLQSYMNYADSLAGRFSGLLFAAGDALDCCIVGEVLQGIAKAINAGQNIYVPIEIGEAKVAAGIVNATDLLNLGYSEAQRFMLTAFATQSMATTASKVVEDNTLDADGASHAKIPAIGEALLTAQLGCFAGGSLGGEVGNVSDDLCNAPPVSWFVGQNKGYAIRYKIPRATSAADHPARTWAADRYANLIMQARDYFSGNRNYTNGFKLGFSMAELSLHWKKRGSTDLVDYNRWVAADDAGLDLKVGLWCDSFWGGICFKQKGTLGLGGAAALPESFMSGGKSIIDPGISLTKGKGGPDDYSYGSGNEWYSPYDEQSYDPYGGALDNVGSGADLAEHPTDQGNMDVIADLARAAGNKDPVPPEATPEAVAWLPVIEKDSSGLQDYNDTAPDKAVAPYATSIDDKTDVGPVFTVYVRQEDKTVRTGGNIGIEKGRLLLKGKGLQDSLSAVSSAQVYYDRPWWNLDFLGRHMYSKVDNNNKRELGNLFEPYWQVRLVETPSRLKLILNGL